LNLKTIYAVSLIKSNNLIALLIKIDENLNYTITDQFKIDEKLVNFFFNFEFFT